MKTTILFFLVLITMGIQAQDLKYRISRYEETPSSLFICINSTVSPNYIEHNFSDKEMNTPTVRKQTIERLVAELQLKDAEYKAPEKVTSKVQEAEKLVLDTVNIRMQRVLITFERKTEQDSIAKAVLLQSQPAQTVTPAIIEEEGNTIIKP